MDNQPDIVDKERERAAVIDMAIPADSNVRNKEHEKIQQDRGLTERLVPYECPHNRLHVVFIESVTHMSNHFLQPQNPSFPSEHYSLMKSRQTHTDDCTADLLLISDN